jgi:hypothetical protein
MSVISPSPIHTHGNYFFFKVSVIYQGLSHQFEFG